MNNAVRNKYLIITLVLLALFNALLHLIVSFNLEYHRDELLYFSLGQHPALGYATVPPMIGWVSWLMQNIFGYSLFAVRICPAILSGVMVFLVSGIARELGGSAFSRILAAIGIIISLFGLRTFLFFQPVHIDLIFWTLIFYLVVRYINTSAEKYLFLLGIVAGFALLNKYLIGLLLMLFLIVLPFTRYRNVFINRKFWSGLLGGFIIFLPNLIWQFAHGLPLIEHLEELRRTQLVNVSASAFLTEQLLIPGLATLLTVAGLLYIFTDRNAGKFRFTGIVAVSVILILLLLQGKNYYTQGIFPFLIAAGAVAWGKILKRTWTRIFFIIMIIILSMPGVPIGIPVYKTDRLVSYFEYIKEKYGMDFVTRFEDNSIHSLPQDYADMLGWEELTSIVSRGWQKIPDKSTAFIYCENYGQAGAVTVIGKKYGLPDPISFNESFRYWIPEKFDREIRSVIYVNDELGEDVESLFRKITLIGTISNTDAREYGTGVWLCEDPSASFNKFWTERINEIDAP